MTRTLIFWKPSRLTTRFIDDVDSMGSTCQTSHQPRVNFFPHTDLNTGSKSDRRMLTNPAQAVDCGPSTALSEILLFPSQSSPFPILRDQSLLAPEYHREYGRVQGFNPREASLVHSGLSWRRLRGQPAWGISILPFSGPSRNTGLRREWTCVDASHNATGFLFGTWRVNATRYYCGLQQDMIPEPSLQPKTVYGSAAFRPILYNLRDWGSCATNHASFPSD